MSSTVAPSGRSRTDQPARPSGTGTTRWWILIVVCLAQLMVVLDATIVNIALPTAQADLGFSDDSRQWVVTGYSLAFGSLLLVGGRLGDLVGRKWMLLIGLAGFAAASAIGGAATSFDMLVAARVGQGLFGALLAPAALSVLTTTFHQPHERGRAFAIYGAIAGSGGAIGLLLGGTLTEYVSWRWCLYVNLPIAIVALVGGFLLLRGGRPDDSARLDIPGSLLSVAGLVAVVYGLANAETDGWGSATTVGFIVAGLVLLGVFAWVETTVANPLLPLSVVLDRNRGGSYIAVGIAGAGMFGVFLFLTYYLSTVLGFGALATGVAFLPMVAGLMVAAQVSTRLVERVGPKVPVATGFSVSAAGMFVLTLLDLDSSYLTGVLPGLILVGVGLGMVMAPAMNAATDRVDRGHAGVASAAVNTFQQIGGSVGTAVFSAIAASAAADFVGGKNPNDPAVLAAASVESYTSVFLWAGLVFAAGAVVSGLLLRRGAVVRAVDVEPVAIH